MERNKDWVEGRDFVGQSLWVTNPKEPEDRWWYAVADTNTCMENHGWFKVRVVEIPVGTPPRREDVIPEVVASLQKVITEARAQFQSKVREIEDEIQNLLAVGYDKPRPVDDDFNF